MDDFRVGSISPYEPYRDGQKPERAGDRKGRRQKSPDYPEEDGFTSTADEAEAEVEAPEAVVEAASQAEPQDYYIPAEPVDE